jgi:hypothetical protein
MPTAIIWQAAGNRWQVLTDNGSSVAAQCPTEESAIARAIELGYFILRVERND